MRPLRWSPVLHLVLLCWLAAALQVIEGKILLQLYRQAHLGWILQRRIGGLKQSLY